MHGYRFFEGNALPDSCATESGVMTFKTDFRVWLRYGWALEENGTVDLSDLFEHVTPDIAMEDIAIGVAWFHSCGDSERAAALDIPPNIARVLAEKKPNTSLYWDFWQVWASFKQQHGIDLYDADLHWWEFKRLLGELKDNTPFRWLERFRSLTADDFKGQDGKVTAKSRKDWDEVKVEQVYRALPGVDTTEE